MQTDQGSDGCATSAAAQPQAPQRQSNKRKIAFLLWGLKVVRHVKSCAESGTRAQAWVNVYVGKQ